MSTLSKYATEFGMTPSNLIKKRKHCAKLLGITHEQACAGGIDLWLTALILPRPERPWKFDLMTEAHVRGVVWDVRYGALKDRDFVEIAGFPTYLKFYWLVVDGPTLYKLSSPHIFARREEVLDWAKRAFPHLVGQ